MFIAKVLFVFGCVLAIASASPSDDHIVGAPSSLSGADLKEAEEQLSFSLTKLSAGDGPNYKISKVHSATRQVVSGSLYKINADLISDNKEVKNCLVSIWSQPWLDEGYEVTFECQGQQKVVKKHSS